MSWGRDARRTASFGGVSSCLTRDKGKLDKGMTHQRRAVPIIDRHLSIAEMN